MLFPGEKPASLSAYGISIEDAFHEDEFVRAFMTFPDDDFSAYQSVAIRRLPGGNPATSEWNRSVLDISSEEADEYMKRSAGNPPIFNGVQP
ncbi:hypothetical protein SAMN04488523_11941 [Sulfitobacter brevis]|uniref:Uncharacterized protein n=1 Tax=Sulfitobacter brevis TaxID=74348 RepID=A0A1I2G5T8_9RHOB|nr:hypothetical protein SAMN04488523_11941 [Sulfitobacter brevis]